jgi:hypothetical protein
MFGFKDEGCNVLLVGEGNFSFTVALLKKFVTTQNEISPNVISTCYQKFKELSTAAKTNAQLANKLGSII